MLSIYKVLEPLHMLWMAIQHHHQCVLVTQVDLDFDIRAEILDHSRALNHAIVQWLRLHTHPELIAHQC